MKLNRLFYRQYLLPNEIVAFAPTLTARLYLAWLVATKRGTCVLSLKMSAEEFIRTKCNPIQK